MAAVDLSPDPEAAFERHVELTGLFLFGVGVFGAYHRPVMRHWALWGYVPLDWFYLVLLLVGVAMMYAYSPLAPWSKVPPPGAVVRAGPQAIGTYLVVRTTLLLGMVGTLVMFALRR